MDIINIISLTLLLSVATIFDLRVYRIPNVLTYSFMLFGLICNTCLNGFEGTAFSIIGTITGIGLLFIPYLFGWIGAGDAKLLGAIGAFIGAMDVFVAFIFSALIGGIYAIFVMVLFRDKFREFFSMLRQTAVNIIVERKLTFMPISTKGRRPRLCYGIAIAAGTGIYMMLQLNSIEIFTL